MVTSHSTQRIIFWILISVPLEEGSESLRGYSPHSTHFCHYQNKDKTDPLFNFKLIASSKIQSDSPVVRLWCTDDQKLLIGKHSDGTYANWKSELNEEVMKKCSVCSAVKAFDFRETCVSCFLPFCTNCVDEKVKFELI